VNARGNEPGRYVRALPRWARWLLYAIVFGGTAAAFYFNFGRIIDRLSD
jgi:hypothetical protein